jgi:hypothetical protein
MRLFVLLVLVASMVLPVGGCKKVKALAVESTSDYKKLSHKHDQCSEDLEKLKEFAASAGQSINVLVEVQACRRHLKRNDPETFAHVLACEERALAALGRIQ